MDMLNNLTGGKGKLEAVDEMLMLCSRKHYQQGFRQVWSKLW